MFAPRGSVRAAGRAGRQGAEAAAQGPEPWPMRGQGLAAAAGAPPPLAPASAAPLARLPRSVMLCVRFLVLTYVRLLVSLQGTLKLS